jgi:hypothetical protein
MALFTSVQTGDFNAASTWNVGSGFPGNMDTFAIGAGHVVTIPNGLAANTSGVVSGSNSANRGELVIADGGSLQLTGELDLNNWNHLQIDGGGELDLNGNNVTVDNSTAEVNKITIVGTANNRAKVSSSVIGTGNFQRDTGGGMPGIITVNYADFIDCGKIDIGDNYFSPNKLDVRNTVFVGCDETTLGGFQHGDNDYIISGVDFRDDRSSTLNIALIERTDGAAATGTGTQLIERITAVANTADRLRWQLDGVDRSAVVTDRVTHVSVNGRGGHLLDSFIRMP